MTGWSVECGSGATSEPGSSWQRALPPYIHKRLDDPDRYQTVYSSQLGSAAAPTAGLHFTPELIERLKTAGVGWTEVTLDIGLDTFRPVSVDDLSDHKMHSEICRMKSDAAEAIAQAKDSGGRSDRTRNDCRSDIGNGRQECGGRAAVRVRNCDRYLHYTRV